jgi:hypothetical protein
MTIPGLILGTLVGALIGGLLHLLVGGHIGRLFLYLIFGFAGFWLGHIAAEILGWTFLSYGPVHVGLGVLFSLAVTGLGYWLSLVQTVKKPSQ